MYSYLRNKLLFFARSLEAAEMLEDFIISSVSTIIIVRVFLTVTGYPQIGGNGLHIAHVLWGGLLMGVSVLFSLSFLNKEAKRLAAIGGGVGFGLFIDEMGKFLTSDNNYFFEPTFAFIYLTFIILFLMLRSISKIADVTDKEYAINAIEIMKEIVFYDLDPDEKEKALKYLSKSDKKNPLVKALRESLANFTPENIVEDMSWVSIAKRKIKDFSFQLITNGKISRVIVVVFILISLFRLYLALNGVEWEWDFWEWGRQLSSITVFLIVLQGLNLQRRRFSKAAYEVYQKAALLSILVVQFFDFYFDQLSALFYLIINILIYVTLYYILEEYKKHQYKKNYNI